MYFSFNKIVKLIRFLSIYFLNQDTISINSLTVYDFRIFYVIVLIVLNISNLIITCIHLLNNIYRFCLRKFSNLINILLYCLKKNYLKSNMNRFLYLVPHM